MFQKAADTNEEEREKEKMRHETRKEPKKLKHISFHNTSSTQPDILEERRKREEEIRPLGGVIRVSFIIISKRYQHTRLSISKEDK